MLLVSPRLNKSRLMNNQIYTLGTFVNYELTSNSLSLDVFVYTIFQQKENHIHRSAGCDQSRIRPGEFQ
jgi:hypothetical protein